MTARLLSPHRTLSLKTTLVDSHILKSIARGTSSLDEHALRRSLTKTYNYERYGAPARRGDRWYYSYNEGLKAQSVHYTIENDRIDGKDRGTVFFDPNTLSEDGTLSVQSHYCKLMYS